MTKITKSTRVKKARIIYEGKPKRKSWLVTGIISLVIIILALFLVSHGTFFIFEESLLPDPVEKTGDVIVTVNGEAIYAIELDEQWDALPMETKVGISRTDVLERMIEEKLLIQKATEFEISVTDEEVEQFVNEQLTILGITPEMFEQYLQIQNLGMKEVMDIYKDQLLIVKLFEDNIGKNISITQEEVDEYYKTYKEDFFQEEMVSARHILVEVSENFDETQAQERVDEILGLLEDDFSNFCELVANYSMDLGSAQTCGEYTFAKGQFNNPDFEDPAFEMEVDELRVVKTAFGLHIMLKTEAYLEKQLDLEDEIIVIPDKPNLQTLIEEALKEQKAQILYDEFVASLREESDVVYEIKDVEEVPEITIEDVLEVVDTELLEETIVEEEANEEAANAPEEESEEETLEIPLMSSTDDIATETNVTA